MGRQSLNSHPKEKQTLKKPNLSISIILICSSEKHSLPLPSPLRVCCLALQPAQPRRKNWSAWPLPTCRRIFSIRSSNPWTPKPRPKALTSSWSDAKGDAATQVDQIQDLITRGIKAIIYIPAGATAAGVPVKAARKANIPVVNVDRNAPDAPGDTFIATDSVAAAKTLGEHVCKVTGGKANIAIIQGQLGTTPEMDRDKGFNEAVANCPGIKVVAKQPSKAWMQDEGFAIAQDMLQRYPNIRYLFRPGGRTGPRGGSCREGGQRGPQGLDLRL